MYQNLTSDISQSRPHTSSIFMSFSIKSGTRNSKMEWKPEPEIVFGAILAKKQISGFLVLVSRWYVYVRRRRDRHVGLSTSDALDRRRGLETELLCPGEPTPITLSVGIEAYKNTHNAPRDSENMWNVWKHGVVNKTGSTQNITTSAEDDRATTTVNVLGNFSEVWPSTVLLSHGACARRQTDKLECGPVPTVMAALSNVVFSDCHYVP